MKMSDYYRQQMEEALELARKYERCPEDQQKAAGAAEARRSAEYYRTQMEEALTEENMNNEKENTMNTLTYTEHENGDITTIDGVGTVYAKINNRYYRTPVNGKKTRISKDLFEVAVEDIRYYIEQDATDHLVLTEDDGMITITPEDIERDARELEAYIANAEEDAKTEEGKEIADLYCRHPEGTDLQVPAVLNQYGCVDCSKCNVQNCVHRDCMRRNPTSEGGLAECPRLKVKAEPKKVKQPKKAKSAKKNAAYTFSNGGVVFTLTEKQVDFIHHLPDTCFWEDGIDSIIWTDCLCDDIGGQFAGKPMTVGAIISTLCEKGLGSRTAERKNGRKCTSFTLTDWGKAVARDLGLN